MMLSVINMANAAFQVHATISEITADVHITSSGRMMTMNKQHTISVWSLQGAYLALMPAMMGIGLLFGALMAKSRTVAAALSALSAVLVGLAIRNWLVAFSEMAKWAAMSVGIAAGVITFAVGMGLNSMYGAKRKSESEAMTKTKRMWGGGIITRESKFVAGEHGAESIHIVPLGSTKARAMGSAGGGAGGPTVVVKKMVVQSEKPSKVYGYTLKAMKRQKLLQKY